MKIDSIGRDVAYIKHSLKNCRISPSNEGKTQETQGSYAHLFVTQASRTYSHATSMLAKDSFGTAVGLREERVLVAMTVALGEAGQPYVPSVDAYAEQRLFSIENTVTPELGGRCAVLH
jgi:hypothetical protein